MLALTTLLYYLSMDLSFSINFPPKLIREPEKEIIFDPRVNQEIPCEAVGAPQPRYYWKKDRKIFTPSAQDNRIAIASKTGTLIITTPQAKDQGFYQCFAENKLGTALSQSTHLKMSELGSFSDISKPVVKTVSAGDSLVLECNVPTGVPSPSIYWTLSGSNEGDEPGKILPPSSRVTQDYHGRLYFINVKEEDEANGMSYVCNAYSPTLNMVKKGSETVIKVLKGSMRTSAPKSLWCSENFKVFMLGATIRLKCIFAGYPTPKVIWRKRTGDLPVHRYTLDSEGQELLISSAHFNDSGIYECQGSNECGTAFHSITVNIESAPFWEQKPTDVNTSENETVKFLCSADGSPSPSEVEWFHNGILFHDSKVGKDKRYMIKQNTLIVEDVKLSDTAVFQCNVSNKHGYAFANFFLNVIREPPEINSGFGDHYKAVEGSKVDLKCEAFGAPVPKITWLLDEKIISSPRFQIMSTGNLVIDSALPSDSGLYTCIVSNKFGTASINGTLSIKRKTNILVKPKDQDVKRGDYVIFRCKAFVDFGLVPQVDWYKDDKKIIYNGRFYKDPDDHNALKIVDTQFDDSGTYMCVIKTELDEDSASGTLVVQDRPNIPYISNVECLEFSTDTHPPQARILWETTGDNNARVLYSELQYNTSFTPSIWNSFVINQMRETTQKLKMKNGQDVLVPALETYNTTHIPAIQTDLKVNLSCWANYSFRVLVYNRHGASDPSPAFPKKCSTLPCRPYRHPSGVHGHGNMSSNLIIKWDPMEKVEWNAPKFWYEIQWRSVKNVSKFQNHSFSSATVYPPASSFLVQNTPTYTEYEFRVLAKNSYAINGVETALTDPVSHFGFSGEDKPRVIPSGFRVKEILSSKKAVFSWDPVRNINRTFNVNGRLKGLMIFYYRTDCGEKCLFTEFISGNVTEGVVRNLPPWTDVSSRIAVMNDKYTGPASAAIHFKTPEGRPGAVLNLRSLPYRSNGIKLIWDPPDEPNGNLLGYIVTISAISGIYKPAEPAFQYKISDPGMLVFVHGGFKPLTTYRAEVRAFTSKGTSHMPALTEIIIGESVYPSVPTFRVKDVMDSSINITWDPFTMVSPASIFYAKYRKKGYDVPFEKTDDAVYTNFLNIRGLEPGTEYEIILFASDGIENGSSSDPVIVKTAGIHIDGGEISRAPWFIGMVVAISVLLLIVIIVCVLIRERGGKYSVQEDDILNVSDTYEPGFVEYVKAPSDDSGMKNKASLAGKLERDSLDEYGNGNEANVYTEDGSFIGQYNDKIVVEKPWVCLGYKLASFGPT